MEKTDFKTGWHTTAWIEVKAISTYAFINEWTCDKSGNPLNDECLFISHTNFKHRGNETDKLHKYNRESTPDEYIEVWADWDCIKESKKEEILQIAKEYNINVCFKQPKTK